ncbi:MAG: hypothetical protein IH598_12245 [Bacteroidales bacterium]|nr:hypothetical protein [Bacteroidales bacterium]
MEFLLSVDLGIRTGLAMFGSDQKLYWFRSQNFGSSARLRRAIPWLLNQEEDLAYVIIEGGGPLLKIWDAELQRRNLEVIKIMADNWRSELLYYREQQNRSDAKSNAIIYAGKVIEKLSDHKATSLDNNAAEAILIGLYGMQRLNWIRSAGQYMRK